MINLGVVASSGAKDTYFFNTTTGTSQTFETFATAIDSNGDLIVVGKITSGNRGLIVLKYDNDGDLLWQKITLQNTTGAFTAVKVDSSNNIYIAGTPWSNYIASYVVKMDSSGSVVWQKYMANGADVFEAYDLHLDNAGNINVCGRAGVDALLYQLDSTGSLNWQRTLAGSATGNDRAWSVVGDSSNNIYTAVYSRESASASFDATIISHDVNGNMLWQRKYYTTDPDTPQRIVLDSSGALILSGQTRNTTLGATVGFVMKVDATNGNIIWQRNVTGVSFAINAIEGGHDVDSNNNVYALTRKPVGAQNRSIILKWDSSGVLQYSREITAGSASTSQYTKSIKIKNNIMYFTLYTNTPTNALNGKLKTDGTGTGLYTLTGYGASIAYQVDATTDIAGAITDAAGTITQTTSSYTLTTDTLSYSNPTYTTAKVIVP